MTAAFLRSVVDPVEDGLKHGALLSHIELVLLCELSQLLHRELQKTLRESCDLLKVLQDVEVGLLPQVGTVVAVCQLPDVDAVLETKLLLQEVASGLHYALDSKAVCCCQQVQQVLFCHHNRAGVGVFQNEVHYVG